MSLDIRAIVETNLIKAACHLSNMTSQADTPCPYYRSKVLGGPLKGSYLSMSNPEKLAFITGTYERHVSRCITKYVSKGNTVFDVGSNIGYFSLLASLRVGDTGNVFAFEAEPTNFAVLKENINQNQIHNVQPAQYAITSKSGEVTFASFDYSLVGHIANELTPKDANLFTAPGISLDDFVYGQNAPVPDFIKVDVEGAEAEVIMGAERLISEHKPIILGEIREGRIGEQIANFLMGEGYVLEHLTRQFQNGFAYGEVLYLPDRAI